MHVVRLIDFDNLKEACVGSMFSQSTGTTIEDEVHEDEDGADFDDDENPLVEYLYAQGLSLGDEEIGNPWDMLPLREDYLGKPFVTRLTRTNVRRHIMVCYLVW